MRGSLQYCMFCSPHLGVVPLSMRAFIAQSSTSLNQVFDQQQTYSQIWLTRPSLAGQSHLSPSSQITRRLAHVYTCIIRPTCAHVQTGCRNLIPVVSCQSLSGCCCCCWPPSARKLRSNCLRQVFVTSSPLGGASSALLTIAE